MNRFARFLIPALLAASSLAVAGDEIPPPPAVAPTVVPTETPAPYRYQVPPELSDGWAVGDLRREKADLPGIRRAMNEIRHGCLPRLHSLLVARHGRLLLEEYFEGMRAPTLQPLFSCTKGVFSTVFGIAQDQGLLDVEERLYDFYPDRCGKPGWDPRKDGITLGNLLSMTSGLDCNDVGVGNENCGADMARARDWLGFCFGLPMARKPGEAWEYNGCCLSLVSNLIAAKSGMPFPAYAKKYLLGPLGIREDEWVTGPAGVNRVDYGLAWKAREMAKLGQLYLNRGLWKGKRIVSEAWVRDATSPHAPKGQAWGHEYGYLWHLKDMRYQGRKVRVFYARGYRGQEIFASPEADLVCVMTAESDDDSIYAKEEDLFEDAILGSFE